MIIVVEPGRLVEYDQLVEATSLVIEDPRMDLLCNDLHVPAAVAIQNKYTLHVKVFVLLSRCCSLTITSEVKRTTTGGEREMHATVFAPCPPAGQTSQ